MSRASEFWKSAVGKKIVMAVTGIIGVGFLIAHIAGNLLIFAGPAKLNGYSHFLHGTPELLWPARIVLLIAVILHVIAAYSLTQQSHAARPQDYVRRTPQASTLAARLMRWGGVLLLIFIVFHILHFTTGTIRPGGTFVEGDVYTNVVAAFHVWWVSLFYIVSMIFLGLHLYHGAWSSPRTLGVTGPANPMQHGVSALLAVLIWAGFTLVPVGVMLGWVR